MPPESVLCVDDDPNILDAFRRQFRNRLHLQTAPGPEAGLAALRKDGPFAVVVSDLHMPVMDGVQFLAAVRAQSPQTVRIMLTGQADLSHAIGAVNQGNIFRFLVKPCAATILAKVIEAGIDQYRLVTAEQQLMRQTLLGAVEVLAEVLSIAQPAAFSRTMRVRRYVRYLTRMMNLADPWMYEAAAMLSQIGWITLAPDLAAKTGAGVPLTPEETTAFAAHPLAGARMLEKIPRLEVVAAMIGGQLAPRSAGDAKQPEVLGAHMLKAALDFDALRQKGMSHEDCLKQMALSPEVYNLDVLAVFSCLEKIETEAQIRLVSAHDLEAGMIVEQEICSASGLCLLGKGQEITPTILERLSGFMHLMPIGTTFRVRVPGSTPDLAQPIAGF